MKMKRQFLLVHGFFLLMGVAVLVSLVLRAVLQPGSPTRGVPGVDLPPAHVVQALSDPRTRMETALAIGRKRDARALPLLRGFSRMDSDPDVRRACVWAIGEIGDPDASIAVRLRLVDKEVPVRLAATEALGKLGQDGDPIAIGALVDALDDKERDVRLSAVTALGSVTNVAAVEGLVIALASSNGMPVREAAVRALARSAAEGASAALGQALRDSEVLIRRTAVTGLAAKRDERSYPGLANALVDPDATVREIACRAVSMIGEPILPHLKRVLPGSRSMEARFAAVGVLSAMKGPDAVETLLRLLENLGRRDLGRAGMLKDQVVSALSDRGDEILGTLTRLAIEGETSRYAEEAAAGLCAKIGMAAADPIREHILKWKIFPDPWELRLWVKTLGEIGDPRAADVLDFALGQDPELTRETVEEARRGIEAKSGLKLPAAKPVRPLPLPPEGLDLVRTPTARRMPQSPMTKETTVIPDDGVVKLTLRGGITWPFGSGRAQRDIEIQLRRRDGKWLEPAWGYAIYYNKMQHPGRVTSYRAGDPCRIGLELVVNEDSWVAGGYAEYDVELRAAERGLAGKFEGHFNHRSLSGEAVADCREGDVGAESGPFVEAGEHPRLLFRREDLPVLRARAQTALGRRIVRALQAKIAAGKVDDWNNRVDSVRTWTPGMLRGIAMGFLATLFDDPLLGRRAAVSAVDHARTDPYGGEHGERLLFPLHIYGYAHDMTYNFLTPEERKEVEEKLSTFYWFITPHLGLMGNMAGGAPPGAFTAPGPGVLSLLREKGRFDLRPPAEPMAVAIIAAEENPPPREGVPVNAYTSGRMIRNWLLAGPFEAEEGEDPLAVVGGPAAATPQRGMLVPFHGVGYSFVRIPGDAVIDTPGFGRKGAVIKIGAASMTTRTYLYSLLEVEKEQGAVLDCFFPIQYRSVRAWLNGRELKDRAVVLLQPGLHRFMVELTGLICSPYFVSVDGRYMMAQEKKQRWLRRDFLAAKAAHELNGERPGMPIMLGLCRRGLRTVLWYQLERTRRTGKLAGDGMLASYECAYANVTGEPLSRDTPTPVAAKPGSIRSGLGNMGLCFTMHLVPDELRPVMAREFDRRFLSGDLGRLNCLELIAAFVNYPMDAEPAR